MQRSRHVSRTRRSAARWVGTASAASIVLLAPLLAPVTPVHADPVIPSNEEVETARTKATTKKQAIKALRDQLVAAQQSLEELNVAASFAAEEFNTARAELRSARRAAKDARRSAKGAQRDLEAAQTELGAFAAASYRSGGDIADVGALLTADGPTTLVDRANTINVLSTQRQSVLTRVQSAQVVADLLDDQAQDAVAAEESAAAEVKAARDRAAAAVDQQATQVQALDADADRLRAELAVLDADAVRLAEERAAGLLERERRRAEREARREAERREREAAAAAAAAAAAGSGSGSGSGSSGGSGSTAPPPPPSTGGVSRGTTAQAAKAIAFAERQLGTPYLWGGTGPRFDCSGLTMRAWQAAGVNIPRTSRSQYAYLRKIPTSRLRPGDLVFYARDTSDPSTIHHVGLYVGDDRMIEAPYTGANVRYASIWRSGFIGAARP